MPDLNTHAGHALHGTGQTSDWLTRWAHLLPPGGRVLDLACGAGRHAHWLALRGMRVTAVDRDPAALLTLRSNWPANAEPPEAVMEADIENHAWPLAGQRFDGIVITNYLWRPLWPHVLACLSPGGVYMHETFAHGNATVGKPSRPDFLLQPGELLRVCQDLRVVAFEDGFCQHPDRYVQRVVAMREADCSHLSAPPRYRLDASAA